MTGHVSIGKGKDGAYGLAVELIGRFASVAKEQAEALMHEAHMVCPYSHAVRGNVEVTLTVQDCLRRAGGKWTVMVAACALFVSHRQRRPADVPYNHRNTKGT